MRISNDFWMLPELTPTQPFLDTLAEYYGAGIHLAPFDTDPELTLPKFEVSGDIPLAKELQDAGMVDAFDPNRADFTPIGPDIYISDAFHKARLTLDEEGTEAAAATAFVGVTVSIPPEPIPVTLDRPFLFTVRDKTGAPLFIGQLGSPE